MGERSADFLRAWWGCDAVAGGAWATSCWAGREGERLGDSLPAGTCIYVVAGKMQTPVPSLPWKRVDLESSTGRSLMMMINV